MVTHVTRRFSSGWFGFFKSHKFVKKRIYLFICRYCNCSRKGGGDRRRWKVMERGEGKRFSTDFVVANIQPPPPPLQGGNSVAKWQKFWPQNTKLVEQNHQKMAEKRANVFELCSPQTLNYSPKRLFNTLTYQNFFLPYYTLYNCICLYKMATLGGNGMGMEGWSVFPLAEISVQHVKVAA
jgi:hypothetical protein